MESDHSCENLNGKELSVSVEKISDKEYVNDSNINDFTNVMFEDLLILILSFVPAKDLILNCRIVCKQWKLLIDSQVVWRLKCERENVKLPTRKFLQLPNYYYRNVYIHSTSKKKNLVKNPCGENKFEGWITSNSNGAEFIIENPPVDSDPVPTEIGSSSCFTTSYFTCQKYQYINLAENPINKYLLEHDLVDIKIGEWFAARFDSAALYELQVTLYDKNHEIIDCFKYWYIERLFSGGQWDLVTCKFAEVTEAHSIQFSHKSECVFANGHHGSKMTGAFVELCIK